MKKKNLLMTAIAIFGLVTTTIAQVPSYVPTNGLVGWWPFNGNANDESGNGNNGTVNGAALTTDRFGVANKAYQFDGTDDFIEVLNNSNLQNLNSFSISLWYKINQWEQIGSNFWFATIEKPASYSLQLKKISLDSASVALTDIYHNEFAWNNLVITFVNNIQKTYSNGVLMDSISNNFNSSNQSIFFGKDPGGILEYTNGLLDDIGFWNRALSPCEIVALYNGQNPTQPITACYETATFNTTTCQWDVTGTQPTQPTTACYETATFNTTTCQWDVTDSPASISQPTNQTVNINNNAQFIVSSSDPSATYQWQTDLGVGFQTLNSVGQYSGTTNYTLTVSNVTMSNNNQPFRCIVYSGSCSDTSNVAVLTVYNNVGIDESSQDNLFSVFPNPARSVINIKADSKLIGEVYTIYDNTGKVVLTGKLNSQNTTIELGTLSGGIYMFSVGENMNQTFKVIKE